MWTKNVDAEYIILQTLLQQHEKFSISEIRRASLKELCDEILYNKTNGSQEMFGGGSFQRALKSLEDKMAFRCIKIKEHKATKLIIDIPRIRSLLLSKKFGHFSNDANVKITEPEIPPIIWESIAEQDVDLALDSWIKTNDHRTDLSEESIKRSYLTMKEATKKIGSFFTSSLFDFIIQHEDKNFQLEEGIATELADAAFRIMSKNQRMRFKLLIEYKGMTDNNFNLGILLVPRMFRTIIAKYFVQWTKDVFDYDVSIEDQKKLQEIRIHLLSSTAKQYYDIFSKSLEEYIRIYGSIKSKLLSC